MSSSPKESAKAADVTEEDTRDFVLPETGSKKKGGKAKLGMYIGIGYGVGWILWLTFCLLLVESYATPDSSGWRRMTAWSLVWPFHMPVVFWHHFFGSYGEVDEAYKHSILGNPTYFSDGRVQVEVSSLCYKALDDHLKSLDNTKTEEARQKEILSMSFYNMMKIDKVAQACYHGKLAKANVAKFFNGKKINQEFKRAKNDAVVKAGADGAADETTETYDLSPENAEDTFTLPRSALNIKYVMSTKSGKPKSSAPGGLAMSGAGATGKGKALIYLQTEVNTEYEAIEKTYKDAKAAPAAGAAGASGAAGPAAGAAAGPASS